jgi:hypothetical protein
MPPIPRAFLNFKEFINFCMSLGLIFSGGVVVYGFEQIFNSSLHQPFMVFVTHVMARELIFQEVSNCVVSLGRMKFKA